MTETINTAEIFKNKQNFSNFIERCADKVTDDLLKNYPKKPLNIIYPQLTQSSDGILNFLSRLAKNQKAYVFWFIANEKEELKNTAITLNNYFDKNYCGIFIVKTVLNGDKIEFKPLLKPENPTKYDAETVYLLTEEA